MRERGRASPIGRGVAATEDFAPLEQTGGLHPRPCLARAQFSALPGASARSWSATADVGERLLESDTPDCASLDQPLSLVIALAIDSLRALPKSTLRLDERPRSRWFGEVALAVSYERGLLPAPTIGFGINARSLIRPRSGRSSSGLSGGRSRRWCKFHRAPEPRSLRSLDVWRLPVAGQGSSIGLRWCWDVQGGRYVARGVSVDISRSPSNWMIGGTTRLALWGRPSVAGWPSSRAWASSFRSSGINSRIRTSWGPSSPSTVPLLSRWYWNWRSRCEFLSKAKRPPALTRGSIPETLFLPSKTRRVVSNANFWKADAPPAPLRDSGCRPKAPDATTPTIRQMVEDYSVQVWRALRYCGARRADLHDACQDVFLVIYRKLDGFEHRSSMGTWVYGICMRVASTYRRTAIGGTRTWSPKRPSFPCPPRSFRRSKSIARVSGCSPALDKLDAEKREVFVLFEIEDRPMAEIAAMLGCPLRTVYSRLEAARKSLASGSNKSCEGTEDEPVPRPSALEVRSRGRQPCPASRVARGDARSTEPRRHQVDGDGVERATRSRYDSTEPGAASRRSRAAPRSGALGEMDGAPRQSCRRARRGVGRRRRWMVGRAQRSTRRTCPPFSKRLHRRSRYSARVERRPARGIHTWRHHHRASVRSAAHNPSRRAQSSISAGSRARPNERAPGRRTEEREGPALAESAASVDVAPLPSPVPETTAPPPTPIVTKELSETEVLMMARRGARVRSGGALRWVREHEHRFASPTLAQEREIIAIDAFAVSTACVRQAREANDFCLVTRRRSMGVASNLPSRTTPRRPLRKGDANVEVLVSEAGCEANRRSSGARPPRSIVIASLRPPFRDARWT